MMNEVLIPNDLVPAIKRLPTEQYLVVRNAIDSLEQSVSSNSRQVFVKGWPEPNLYETRAGDLHVYFQYIPERHRVLLVDITGDDYEALLPAKAVA